MEEAITEALACGEDVPVGCVIVKDAAILARARNTKELTQDPCAHAEILAIRQATSALGTWRLEGCALYTTLEPCPMCAGAILQARLSRLVFGAFDKIYGAAGSVFDIFIEGRNYPVPDITGGVEEERCSTMLKEFFKRQRAKNKEVRL